MNKKYMAILLALMMVVLAACGKSTQEETTAPDQTTAPQQTTEAPVETTEEVTIPGLEDSIFDEEPVETTQPETTPATKPAGSTGGSGTGPDAPDAPENKPETSKPEETKPQETKPQETQPPVQETAPSIAPRSEYEEFQNMTPSQQQEVMNSFESIDAFFDWYNAAREEHDRLYPDIEIGDGSFDMGQLTGSN